MKIQWKHILLLFLSASLLEVSFAPFNQFYTAFFALVPFLWVLIKTRNAFLTGLIWGVFYCIFSIHWLAFNSGTYPWLATLSMLLAAVFLSLNYAVIAMLFKLVYRKNDMAGLFLLPFIWVAIEFLRSFGTFGFPWLALGHSQAHHTLYIQHADIGGVYIVSFMLVVTNLLILLLIRSFSKKRLILLIISLLLPFLYGIIMLSSDLHDDKALNFRIVQPNIGAKEKWRPDNRLPIIHKLDSLSRIETDLHPHVIVWPETAIPYYLRSSLQFTHILERCATDMKSTLITGTLDFYYQDSLSWHSSTNSLFVIEPVYGYRQQQIYDKLHLVPFGEFTPGGQMFSWLNNMQYGQSDFTSRNYRRVLHMTKDSIAFTPMICYDSVFPHTIRRFASQGSQYNILVTNDIWFGRSMGPHQHAAIAIVRAVETRLPLIRSANAGISMFIDEKGRVLDSIPLYTTGIIDHRIHAGHYIPLFVKTGNLFSIIITISAFFGIIASLWIKEKK